MNEFIFQGASSAVSAVLTAATGEHLFGINAQLLFDTAVTAVNVFLMSMFLSYLLFNPARKFLEGRRSKIAQELETAKTAQETAEALKAEYEAKMAGAAREAEEILRDARKRGLDNQTAIVNEANEEAARIRQRAKREIELEKQHAMDDVKNEVVTLASAIAAKVVSAGIDTRVQNDLVEETIRELDEGKWQE